MVGRLVFDAGIGAVGLPLLMTASFADGDRDRAAPAGRLDDARDLCSRRCSSSVVCAPFVTLGSVGGGRLG